MSSFYDLKGPGMHHTDCAGISGWTPRPIPHPLQVHHAICSDPCLALDGKSKREYRHLNLRGTY
jgi:hypothetical protein